MDPSRHPSEKIKNGEAVQDSAHFDPAESRLSVIYREWYSVIASGDCAAAVRIADAGRQALAGRLGPDRPVHPFVCLADSTSEPRELPAPSGAVVVVTGLPWLSGLLRNRLGAGTEAAEPDPETAAARWRGITLGSLRVEAIRRAYPPGTWVIENLLPDDRIPQTIDLVIAGPTGAFVIAADVEGDQQTVERVSFGAARLRAYLPHIDVIPAIVSRSVTAPRFGPADNAGYPIAWLQPEQALAFLGSVRRRGLTLPEVAVLNAPAPGWYRHVTIIGDGIDTRFGWC
ncbi:hypothetical protein ACIA5D_17270 [Actinoplanes sp. NPDC051513]|uniref:hypothetical protein n=1 Tax=Actinoplanes sp. NPDC051513 TaxID=3363908 RepID=UPI0037AB14E5